MPARWAPGRRSRPGRMFSRSAWSLLLLLSLLHGLLERNKSPIPELVEVRAKGAHALGVELIEQPSALLTVDHQARLLEHLEVLGDRGTRDRQPPGELTPRAGAFGQELEDG